MRPVVDERLGAAGGTDHADLASQPELAGQIGKAGKAGQRDRGKPRHGAAWLLLSALALGVALCVAVLASGAFGWHPAASQAVRQAASTGGAGLVRVLPGTDQARGGPGFAEVNGIADGLGRLWLTGGSATQNHVLYAVDPATGRIGARIDLPSRLVINPNDVATGAGAVWVAVGASIYRVGPAAAQAGGAVTRAFAAVPQGGLVGDVVTGAGAVWATDTTNGRVYRFAASTGRLDAVVKVGTTAGAMTVGDGGIWVADDDAHTVSRISVSHNRVDAVRTVPGVAGGIAATAGGLWVTDGAGDDVTFLPGASGRAVTVPVGQEPTGIVASGNTVWVVNTAGGTLSRIDAPRHTVVATVPVGTRPYAVAADRDGVWVTVLGRPVMMHTSSGASSARGASAWPAWLVRLCGGL